MASLSNHEQEVDQDCIQSSLKIDNSYTESNPSMASSSSSSNHEREVNQELWQACAGVEIDIPKLNSLVYYFPRDHFEHCSSSPIDDYLFLSTYYDSHLCRVTNVSFHAHPYTDQVFVKFLLQTCKTDGPNPAPIPIPNPNPIRRNRINDNAVTFVKVLSKSDIPEGLLVTKPLIDSIFSHLPQNPGREIIQLIDIHGKIWEFMLQLKDGMDNRLTGGWYDFARIKNLKEGDSIVFMLNKSTNECHVGIRRAVMNRPIRFMNVYDAIESSRNMKSFEVVYYPIRGLPEFVVQKEKVDNTLHVRWRREQSVMIAYEFLAGGHEPIKCWHHGRILDYVDRDITNWPDCWWRVLQITWHVSPEIILEKMPNLLKDISPWELEASDQESSFIRN